MATANGRKNAEISYRVGDAVRFTWGVTPVEGKIVEYVGAIGRGGRRIFRVIVDQPEAYFHLDIELPEENLERVA
jgi:hypothetical protein